MRARLDLLPCAYVVFMIKLTSFLTTLRGWICYSLISLMLSIRMALSARFDADALSSRMLCEFISCFEPWLSMRRVKNLIRTC